MLAAILLAGGGWALWEDRVARDANGFVSIGTSTLRTETYAIVGKLRGGGPSWVYGSSVLGTGRVRATSQSDQPLFIGIAPTDDVNRLVDGVGYATIHGFETSAGTTHAGGAPSAKPADLSIWATSTEGTGQQTLLWKPRDGDWSVVFMNADASGGVVVRGNLSAKVPALPWVAAGLLIAGVAAAVGGGWLVVRGLRARREEQSSTAEQGQGSGPLQERPAPVHGAMTS